MNARENDLLLFIADTLENARNYLGNLRVKLAQNEKLINPDEYKLTWIIDFPLLEYDPEENRYVAMHHPFTSP